ncbi:hypothetical protein F511_38317 [Dorcoceras hygrometricum]|uniref:Uncharacterized protein n=1 Tax=Dorcoceras hygrometricum TaxID=472368 RepID=A0A2Z7CF29_9LAMI|nr:hypothetical protein F511_38317 [Dorcoceras hygrometricum]
MKHNLAVAVTSGEPQFLPKARHEYTNEDKKKDNLDNQHLRKELKLLGDILYRQCWMLIVTENLLRDSSSGT